MEHSETSNILFKKQIDGGHRHRDNSPSVNVCLSANAMLRLISHLCAGLSRILEAFSIHISTFAHLPAQMCTFPSCATVFSKRCKFLITVFSRARSLCLRSLKANHVCESQFQFQALLFQFRRAHVSATQSSSSKHHPKC